jgi:hypothetical protein
MSFESALPLALVFDLCHNLNFMCFAARQLKYQRGDCMEKRKRKIVGAMVQRWMNHWRLYSLSWHYIWSSVYTNEKKFVRTAEDL